MNWPLVIRSVSDATNWPPASVYAMTLKHLMIKQLDKESFGGSTSGDGLIWGSPSELAGRGLIEPMPFVSEARKAMEGRLGVVDPEAELRREKRRRKRQRTREARERAARKVGHGGDEIS